MIYDYQTEDGRIVTLTKSLSEAIKEPLPEVIPHPDDGAPAKRVWSQVAAPSPRGWPMQPCVASGVRPEQAQELRDLFKKAGVPTEVTRDGDPIYTSLEHRRRALKARGLVDRSGY